MESERTGETFLRTNLDTIAYSVIRMPATYSAIRTCLEKVLEVYDFDIKFGEKYPMQDSVMITFCVDTIFGEISIKEVV